jgi:hypothetical protein
MNFLFKVCNHSYSIKASTSVLARRERAAGGTCSVNQGWHVTRENIMGDVIWVAVTIAFFALAIGYVRFCDRVK